MADSPDISSLPSEQLSTSHVEDLPTVEPDTGLLLSIRFFQMRPYFCPTRRHLPQPVLTGLRVVPTVDPPLPSQDQVVLEEVQQVGGGHGPTSEEVRSHPALLEIVR